MGDGVRPASIRAPRSRIRRQDILDVAAQLFATKGVSTTTVRDIGAVAGVHAGSLYYYFESKDTIAVELLQTYVAALEERYAVITASPEPPLQRLRGLMRSALATIGEHPEATRIFLHDYQYLQDRGLLVALQERLRTLRTFWIQVINEGMQDGSLRADLPADVVSRVLRDALWSTGNWPAHVRQSTPEVDNYLIETFLHGIATRNDAS